MGMNSTGLAAFFSNESAKLVNFVRRRLTDSGDVEAEDLVQDVMLSMLERRDPLEFVENLSAFVYQSLRNRVIDKQRKRAAKPASEKPVQENLSDNRSDQWKNLMRGHLAEDIQSSLRILSKKEREVFLAVEVEGKSFAQLSSEKRMPVGTLLSLKSRAAAKLRIQLSHWDPRPAQT